MNGHCKEYADIDTSVATILLVNSVITVGTTIREILVKRFLLTFPLVLREILREKLREIP